MAKKKGASGSKMPMMSGSKMPKVKMPMIKMPK